YFPPLPSHESRPPPATRTGSGGGRRTQRNSEHPHAPSAPLAIPPPQGTPPETAWRTTGTGALIGELPAGSITRGRRWCGDLLAHDRAHLHRRARVRSCPRTHP